MLTNQKVSELLDAFSSPDPTPGGGSAAALAGALGASLLAMVAGMAKTKSGTPAERAALDEARTRLLELRRQLVELVERDSAAYDQVVAAYRKPRETEEEKAARGAAIREALRVATEVPLETIRVAVEAMNIVRTVAEHGNPGATSDIVVGQQLLSAAHWGALVNVETNLSSLPDQSLVEALTKQLRTICKEARHLHSQPASGVLDLMKQAALRAFQLTPEGDHPRE